MVGGLSTTNELDDSEFLIGGSMTELAGVAVSGLARWSARGAEPFGTFTGGHVSAIAEMGGSLVVGGQFQSVDGMNSLGLALWTGERWVDLSRDLSNNDGIGQFVAALQVVGRQARRVREKLASISTGASKTRGIRPARRWGGDLEDG